MNKEDIKYKKLSCCSFAIACGSTWGILIFSLTLFNLYSDWGTTVLDVMSSLYTGLDYSIKGAFIGLIWAIGHGMLFGGIIAAIYNFTVKKCFKKCCGGSCSNSSKSCCG